MSLVVPIGKDRNEEMVFTDICEMPHLLIAGSTGSGKSVLMHFIITYLISNFPPQDLRLIMIDPKRIELSSYNGIPHLKTSVKTDVDQAIATLNTVVEVMERRYSILEEAGARNIAHYNQNNENKMPYLVVIIDELADLMMKDKTEVEKSIIRLAQMSRASGIHLIIATQRPSVDIITGLMKANLPTRIAMSVISSVDSRVIIDQPGAEKLRGKGDMLLLSPEHRSPLRLQGVYVSSDQVQKICDTAKATHPEDMGISTFSSILEKQKIKEAEAKADDIKAKMLTLSSKVSRAREKLANAESMYNDKVSMTAISRVLSIFGKKPSIERMLRDEQITERYKTRFTKALDEYTALKKQYDELNSEVKRILTEVDVEKLV